MSDNIKRQKRIIAEESVPPDECEEMRRMRGAVYPWFQPGQILPGMCRTHEADQRRKAQAETTGEMSRFRG